MKAHERFLAEFLARSVIEDPYPLYAALQEDGPLAYVAASDLWLVSGYEGCLAVLKDTSAFEAWDGREFFLGRIRRAPIPKAPQSSIQASDPTAPALPDHAPLHMMVYHALAARQRSVGIEAAARHQAHELVDSFRDEGTVDCVNRFALPLPLLALGNVLGLAREEWAQFFRGWVSKIRPGVRLPHHLISAGASSMSWASFQGYLTEALEERLRRPRDDVLTAIAHAGYGEPRIDRAALVQVIARMSANAVLTTADLIGNAIWLILRHADVGHQIAANPALVTNAVQEAHRVESPVQGHFRRTAKEVELPTGCLPAGAGLLVLVGAANRDARQFPHPDRFDIRRPTARLHLGFGYGAHACIGSPLALMIARIAIETLLTRLPPMHLIEDQQIAHHPNKLNRGLQALYLQFAC